MAYFSNGSGGMVFDNQCAKCKYGQSPCPIALVQIEYNYDQHKDKSGTATKILDTLVKPDGTCTIWEMAKLEFEIDPNQLTFIPMTQFQGMMKLPVWLEGIDEKIEVEMRVSWRQIGMNAIQAEVVIPEDVRKYRFIREDIVRSLKEKTGYQNVWL